MIMQLLHLLPQWEAWQCWSQNLLSHDVFHRLMPSLLLGLQYNIVLTEIFNKRWIVMKFDMKGLWSGAGDYSHT